MEFLTKDVNKFFNTTDKMILSTIRSDGTPD